MPSQLPVIPGEPLHTYRLINSKFPPIALFDDVGDARERRQIALD